MFLAVPKRPGSLWREVDARERCGCPRPDEIRNQVPRPPAMKILSKLSSSALVWSYATTVLRFGGLFLVLPVVLRTVPEEQLGLFYLFQTFAVLSTLLDAGVGPTVMRSASFAWAGAERLERQGHRLVDPSVVIGPNWTLLGRILRTFSRFYLGGAGVLALVLGLGCSPLIWQATADLPDPAQGRWIWIFCVLGSAWNFAGSIWPTMLGGMNRVKDQQAAQLLSIAVGYLTTLGGLLAGWQLWALALSGFVQAIVLRAYAKRVCLRVAKGRFDAGDGGFEKSLFATVWPAAWRTGLLGAGVSAYLSLPVFLTTKFQGLAEAAQIGLAVQLALTVCQVAVVAVLVKVPQFSILKVRGEKEALVSLFTERMLAFAILYITGAIAVLWLGDWILHGVIGSKTPLPSHVTLLVIMVWAGLEGLQSLFRGIALAANDTRVWKPLIVGLVLTTAASLWAIPLGAPGWIFVMVMVKFVTLDIAVFANGFRSLGIGPAELIGAVVRSPGGILGKILRLRPSR